MKAIEIQQPWAGLPACPGRKNPAHARPRQVLIAVAGAGLNNADLSAGARTLSAAAAAHPTFWAWKCRAPSWRWATASLAGRLATRSVRCWPGGGYAEFALADPAACCRCRMAWIWWTRRVLPEAAFTAWTNIVDTGRLQPGETLLIHGGTSGIGSLAHPDVRRARASHFHHRRQRPEMRSVQSFRRGARHKLQHRGFRRRGERGDRRARAWT